MDSEESVMTCTRGPEVCKELVRIADAHRVRKKGPPSQDLDTSRSISGPGRPRGFRRNRRGGPM
eukprot:9458461-Alexandrium_andersonii.AAC.1